MNACRRLLLLATLLPAVFAAGPGALEAQVAETAAVPAWAVEPLRDEPPPLRVAERFGVEPVAVLAEASAGARDQLEALRAWNRAGRRPTQVGFTRPLPLPQGVRFATADLVGSVGLYEGGVLGQTGPATFVWGTEVRVQGAFRLRLHLSDVVLPEGADLWVYGESGDAAGPFGAELVHENRLWTPSVAGPVIRLELELPATVEGASPARFVIDSVLEMVRLGADGGPITGARGADVDASCLIDATCVTPSDFAAVVSARKAVGQLFIVRGEKAGVCSGALLNDQDERTLIPFFLTANHCLETQAEASSLEVFWDYRTSSCGGSFPDPTSKPRSSGATLLATGASSDFTLLRLHSIPGGRELLGWDARPSAVAEGTIVHRIAHPAPFPDLYAFPQAYSRHVLEPSPFECGVDDDGRDWDDPTKFLTSTTPVGGTFGGSSGAPILLPSGKVVGQLLGACGLDPGDGCNALVNDTRDGAFAATFPEISRFLEGNGGEGPQPPPGPWLSTAALPGFEAKVRIGGSRAGAQEGQCIVESLCVSGALAGRPEIFLKVIGPRPNGFLWTQISRFTPSRVEVWLRQTSTGQVNFYELAAVSGSSDDVSGLQDREAFSP